MMNLEIWSRVGGDESDARSISPLPILELRVIMVIRSRARIQTKPRRQAGRASFQRQRCRIAFKALQYRTVSVLSPFLL